MGEPGDEGSGGSGEKGGLRGRLGGLLAPREPLDEPQGLFEYLTHRHDPLTSLVLTVPVFLVYHLGILLMSVRNGVDVVSELTLALLDQSRLAYVGVTLGVAAGLFVAGWWLRRKGKIRPARLVPVLIESTVWAVVMMVTVGWATSSLVPAQAGPPPLGPIEKIVMYCGAGFHEELVFRVGFFAGGAWLLSRWRKLGELGAVAVALVGSSLLFSLVHYVGGMADDLSLMSFTFRTLAGVFLALVYRFRGFAVAVYTHTFYDVFFFLVF